MEYKDYYETMGVARDVTQDEIKRAYRKLARKCGSAGGLATGRQRCRKDPV